MITRREFVIGMAGVTVAGAFADQWNVVFIMVAYLK